MAHGRPQGPKGEGGSPGASTDGCLVAVIRVPVRIVAFVVVLPLRLLWDALTWIARTAGRYVLLPPLRALNWLLTALWRYVLAPVGRVLVVAPAVRLWRYVLRPVLYGIGAVFGLLARWLVVRPLAALWEYVLRPLVRGLGRLLDALVVVPLKFLWRKVLLPVLREVAAAVAAAWRAGAAVGRAIGRGVARLWRVLVVIPVVFVWRRTGGPFFRALGAALRWVRREILHPVRVALADARRALFGR